MAAGLAADGDAWLAEAREATCWRALAEPRRADAPRTSASARARCSAGRSRCRRARSGAARSRSRRGCWPGSGPRARSSAAATPATGGSPVRRGRRCRTGSARPAARSGGGRLRRAGAAAGCGPSAPAPRPTWSGGWARPRPRSAGPWPTSAPCRSSLDGGGTGWVLPDDVEAEPPRSSRGRRCCRCSTRPRWAGSDRDFYLDPDHTPYLFDSNGNGGTTAWWNGRIVGCWVQDDDGVVHVVPREDLGADGRAGARRRGRAAHRLAGRRPDLQRLRSLPDEVRAPALRPSLRATDSLSALVREQPEQQAPPVQRLRIRYAKRGRLRFTSATATSRGPSSGR